MVHTHTAQAPQQALALLFFMQPAHFKAEAAKSYDSVVVPLKHPHNPTVPLR